ncbi:MAG: hypothetical protein JW741_28820 [Sedimentisphaerales bacterium]|nr:hypothetical protein [Sedimentisphaerales bacterium]
MANARNGVLLLLCLLAAGASGCQKRSARPARLSAHGNTEFAAPAWGAAAGGLQCRLRPTKRLWRAGETLAFRVDLRNEGKRVFALAVEPLQPQRIAVDRQWQQRSAADPAGRKMAPFGPGSEFADLPLALPPEAMRRLTKGRHMVQIAFVFEGIEVRSNPVEIEIVG